MDNSIKRVVAYLIDVVIVTIVATLLTSIKAFNPYFDSYNENYDKYVALMEKFQNEEISEEEYKNEYIPLNYELSKESVVISGVTIVLLVGYFGIYQGLANGVTLGKKIMKIQIVSNSDKKLNAGNYILRCVILNNVIFRLIVLIAPFILKAPTFDKFSYIIGLVEGLIECIIFVMVMLRKDGRGLHDIIAGTKVISTVPSEENVVEEKVKSENKKERIEEATFEEVKKEPKTKKNIKKSTKNKN